MDWIFYTNEIPILRQHIIFSHMFLAQHTIRSHCCGPTETETVRGTKNALLSPEGTPLWEYRNMGISPPTTTMQVCTGGGISRLFQISLDKEGAYSC